MDNPKTNGQEEGLEKLLDELREEAIKTNKEWAEKLGIPQSAAITCVKPSGTVSPLIDSVWYTCHNPHYIRTVRADNKTHVCKMMKDAGFPNEAK